jgi:16S rRNA C967 or C1407 C5-methylase (RsmB/RsmF family)
MRNKGKVSGVSPTSKADPDHSTASCLDRQLYAFERDVRRFNTLKTMLSKAQCSNVVPTHKDFLTVDPNDDEFKDVTHM